MKKAIRKNAKGLTAIALVSAVFAGARLPTLSDAERESIADRFRFVEYPLPVVAGPSIRGVRPVHPQMREIAAWISSVGAAVALADLDGDQLSNDVSYVDTRTDQVIVAPVPGTPNRYRPFVLDPGPELYNRGTMAPMGCAPGDFNEDGLTDVLVYYWGRIPIVFLRKQPVTLGGLQPSDFLPQPILPESECWYTNALTTADIDGDGHIDLIVGNYFPDDDHVLDQSSSRTASMQDSMSRAFNGGRNRLLLWSSGEQGDTPAVTFRDASSALEIDRDPIATGWTLAVGAADLDGDLLPEIYFANDFGPDRLLHNRTCGGKLQFALLRGQSTFTTPRSKVLGEDSFKGMGVDFADVNGDGSLDIAVSNIAAEYALEESHFLFVSSGAPEEMRVAMNKGVAPYVDLSEALGVSRSGWGWEIRFGDFDNDGTVEIAQATGFIAGKVDHWPELHEVAMGNDQLLRFPGAWHHFREGDGLSARDRDAFFVRAAEGRYYDVADAVGFGDPYMSRGIATADVDGDGDLDAAIANQWAESRFLRNNCPQSGRFVGLRLLRPVDSQLLIATSVQPGIVATEHVSQPAIGAAASIRLPEGQVLVGQVDGGNGHSGKCSPVLHFGLGDIPETTPIKVELKWRDCNGNRHYEEQTIIPGWHTILLSSLPTTYGGR